MVQCCKGRDNQEAPACTGDEERLINGVRILIPLGAKSDFKTFFASARLMRPKKNNCEKKKKKTAIKAQRRLFKSGVNEGFGGER